MKRMLVADGVRFIGSHVAEWRGKAVHELFARGKFSSAFHLVA